MKTEDAKAEFYDRYVSTHIAHRKGTASIEDFKRKSRAWDRNYGHLLPKGKDSKIIDVGCGSGGLVWWMQKRGYSATEGIDISSEQVEAARSLGIPNVKVADLREHMMARKGHYDRVVLRDVVEHFKKEEVLDILGYCLQALKPGGRLIIQVPNAESPFFGRIRYGDFTHESAYCASSLSQVFNMIGADNFTFHPFHPVFSGLRGMIRRPMWMVAEKILQTILYAEAGPGKRVVTQNIIATAERVR